LETQDQGLYHETHQGQPHLPGHSGIGDNPARFEQFVSRSFLYKDGGKILFNHFRRQYFAQRHFVDTYHIIFGQKLAQHVEYVLSGVVWNQFDAVVQIQVSRGTQLLANPYSQWLCQCIH
jgi:hypothetical protein